MALKHRFLLGEGHQPMSHTVYVDVVGMMSKGQNWSRLLLIIYLSLYQIGHVTCRV